MIDKYLRCSMKIMTLVILAALLTACGSTRNSPSTSSPKLSSEFLYATSFNQIVSFTVNPSTGALSNATVTPGPNTAGEAATIAADPTSKFIFVYDAVGNAIDVFSINGTTGALAAVSGSPFPTGLSPVGGLATDTTGNFVYVAGVFGIAGFSVNNATGALTRITGSPFFDTDGHFGIVADPLGKFIYAGNIGAPQATISGFSLDSSSGVLTEVLGSPFSTPIVGAPFSMAVHPSGKFFYANLGTASSIAGWNVDGATGAFTTVVAGSPFTVGNRPNDFVSSVVIDPTGKFLYVLGPPGGIFGFAIDANSGTLTAISGSPFSPLFAIDGGLLFDPSGQFLYGPGGPAVIGMKVDAPSGALTLLSGSPFPAGATLTPNATLTIAKTP